jgi:hypothetical protein
MPTCLQLRILLLIPLVSLLASACDSGGKGTAGDSGGVPGAVEQHLWGAGYYSGGDWDPDFNDGSFYGTAFYVRRGLDQDNAAYVKRAGEMMAFNAGILQRARRRPLSYFSVNLDAVMMAMLGGIEYMAATGEREVLRDVDFLLDATNTVLAVVYGNYVVPGGLDGSYFMAAYGATVVTSVVALANLQTAVLLPEYGKRDRRVDSARAIVEAIESAAWNGVFFRKDPGDEGLYLYPNVMMMLCYCRLYQATGEPTHIDKAEALFDAIQPLRSSDRPGYRSPYSAHYMGAVTDDYSTLSSQNYLTFALSLLNQVTGKGVYCSELKEVRRFVEEYLLDANQSRLLHHWMDGHIAEPTDREYFCSGCNLQYLYMAWWVRQNTQCN